MAQKKAGNKNGTKPVYVIIAALTLIVLTLLAALIIVNSKSRDKDNSESTPVLLHSLPPEETAAPVTPEITPSPAEPPEETAKPTGTPSSGPTATLTPVPTAAPTQVPKEIPTPTEPVMTDPPATLPVTDKTTSANPQYAGLKLIALTFDDGPNFSVTPDLLDVLAKHNAKATFFVLGCMLDNDGRNREALKREAAEGHEIGCHSWSHTNFKTLSSEEMLSEVSRTDDLVYSLTGRTVTLMRLPGGNYNNKVRDTVQMPFIQWSCDSLDWQQLNPANIRSYANAHGLSYSEAESELIDMIVFKGFDTVIDGHTHYNPPLTASMVHGAILLCHDIYKATPKAIDRLLTYLEEAGGYRFVTVTELVTSEAPSPQAGYVYYKLWGTKI